ncbi:MAG TPA: ferritin [Oligoflexia bacterium]|nr:ferritin [Oligoflexia bacterium]HMP48174.1 ferritin [Oligoflexia bacterium]
MIPAQVSSALQKQLNLEFQAFYKYLAISSYCEAISLNGFAKWFSAQSEEERGHAMKIYQYLLDQDEKIKLLPLTEPRSDFSSIEDAVATALENEQIVTRSINELAGLTIKESDYATHSFLKWFIDEQVEEEATVRTMLDQVKMVKNSGEGLLMLDREFSARGPEEDAGAK